MLTESKHGKMNQRVLSDDEFGCPVSEAASAKIFIDAADYYRSLHENIPKANNCLIFLGWDFDSRLELIRPPDEITNGYPAKFSALLKRVAEEKPNLNVYLLSWDHATYYLPMRELFQKLKFQRLGNPNIRFAFDGKHPLGASHHQKIVIIDDALAYCGGIDITSQRWDTARHLAQDARRMTASGKSYGPYHDVTLAVTGPVVGQLKDIASARLKEAVRNFDPRSIQESSGDQSQFFSARERIKLPEGIEHVRVMLARTLPAYRSRDEVREVETLYLEQIKLARRYIYIENQYLTARVIVEALKQRLLRPDSPEIMIILPLTQTDPLSKFTMGVLTAQAIAELKEADRFDRIFIGTPASPELPKGVSINVHAKVFCCDDEYIRIGSANLNNRSMGLDTECDLTLMADGRQDLKEVFRREVARMLAHHFGQTAEDVQTIWESQGLSFVRLVQQIGTKQGRHLAELKTNGSRPWVKQVARIPLVDPEHTILPEKVADKLFGSMKSNDGENEFFRLVPVGLFLTGLAVIAVSATAQYYDLAALADQRFLLQFIGLFLLSGISLVPFALVVVYFAAALEFQSFPYLMLGAGISSSVSYLTGRLWGPWLNRLPGRWLPLVCDRLTKSDFWTVFWARLFPFAPPALVGVFCGRNGHPFGRYLAATILGLTPYLVLVVVLVTSSLRLLAGFDVWWFVLLSLALTVIVIGLRAIQVRFLEDSYTKRA